MAAKRKTKKRSRRGLGDTSMLRCSAEPLWLRREPLDRGGYTDGGRGRYFGIGEKLWSFSNGDSSGHLRAKDKATAKKLILAKCPATKWAR